MTSSGPNSDWWLYWIVPVSACIVAFFVLIFICIGAATSVHAERSLHAVILATVLTENFVRQEARWPRSWDDLSVIETAIAPSFYSWPKDGNVLKQLVRIDFGTDLDTVASQTAEEFDKIEPTGSCYPFNDDPCVTALLRTANEVVRAKTVAPPSAVFDAETLKRQNQAVNPSRR